MTEAGFSSEEKSVFCHGLLWMETEIGREIGEKGSGNTHSLFGFVSTRTSLSLLLFLTYGNVGFVANKETEQTSLTLHISRSEIKQYKKSCAYTAGPGQWGRQSTPCPA